MSNGDGFIRSLVDGDLKGFRQGFESFLDQCPSFLYHVSAGRFLPVFFFSMFSTAHDANILNENERVYFRFDNHGIDTGGRNRNTGNLKVAVYRDGQQVVRCYSISDRPNSDGLRFSTRERNALVREIRRQNPNLREEDLNFEQYKVCMHGKGKSQGEAIATVFEVIREKDFRDRDKFAKYSASEISLLRQLLGDHGLTIQEIKGRQLNYNQLRQLDRSVKFAQVAQGQQRIDNFMGILANNQRQNVERRMHREVLPYITDIYDNCRQALENNIENRSQKFESHGFLLGFLANFSHRYTIGIDLDLSPRNSHVAFLVRHQAERENIPIVINLAIFDTPSDVALNCAIGYAGRLHNSSFIPIHTTSEHTVCVGLNFNLNLDPFSVDTVGLQQDRFPLVQRLFEYIEDEEVGENIRDFLLQHLPGEIPRNADNYNRVFDCITGFTFGSSAFDIHPLQLEGVEEDEVHIIKHTFIHGDPNLRKRALTMVFHAEGSDIVILHIRAHDAQQQGAINLENLNINGNNVHVWEVSCTLNDQFELDIDQPNDLGLYHDYQNNNANNFLDGDLVQVPNAENVHGISERVMNDGWKNVGQHRGLFQEISGALMPLRDAINVNSEDKFRSILHGTFYASDDPDKVLAMYKIGQTYSLKRRQEEEGERVMLTRITEQRLDLLLLRQSTENAPDTHPIVYVLGFADNAEEVAQKENNAKDRIKELMNKQRGYLPITPGNEVVLSSAVFNAGAQRVEDLISIPQELYIHRLDRSTRGLVGPESVINEIIASGMRLNFAKDKDYYFADHVLEKIAQLEGSYGIASDIVCTLISRGAKLKRSESLKVIDTIELKFKAHKANMISAHLEYVSNTEEFFRIAKAATSGQLYDGKIDNNVSYLEYSEDSIIDVARITDRTRNLELIQESYRRDIIKIGKSEMEIITENGIRYYTDLTEGSDIVLTFYTSLGNIDLRLYPDIQDKSKIIVEVSNREEILEKFKGREEELGNDCALGDYWVYNAIEQGYFERSGKLMHPEVISESNNKWTEREELRRDSMEEIARRHKLLQDLRNIESNIVKKEKNFDVKTYLIDIFKILSRFYEEKGDISKTDLAKAAEKESKKLGLEGKYNWSKIFGLEEEIIEKAEKQGDKEQKSNIPDDFYLGHAINNGSCFFDSFRQSLEQQKGIKVTVEQLRNECKRFAQDNPPEWFISKIGNDFDEVEGEFVNRGITCNQYINSIGKNEFWGRSDIEGRILCDKYGVKLHVAESNPLHTIDKQQDPFLHQLIDSSGSKAGKIDYSHNSVLHMVNGGHDHFQPLLYRNKALAKQTQEQKDSLCYSSLPSCSMDELKIEKASHQQKALLVSRP